MAPSAIQEPLGPAEDAGAESDGSIVTRIGTDEDILEEIRECRERKTLLGGRLSRPIKPFRKEDVLLHPPQREYEDPDEPYFSAYLMMEVRYWRGELRAWESQLVRIQADWQKRNDAAGGTVLPPLPVLEMDPLELHIDYLELIRKKVVLGGREGLPRHFNRGWHFMEYPQLLEHFQAVQLLVEDMRKEHDLKTQSLSTEAERPSSPPDASLPRTRSGKRKRPEGNELRVEVAAEASAATKKPRKQSSKASAVEGRSLGGAQTISKALDTTEEHTKVKVGRHRKQRAAAANLKSTKKSVANPRDFRPQAKDSKVATGRGRSVAKQSSEGSRRSPRLLKLKPEKGMRIVGKNATSIHD